jgi:peptidoglycan/xylan/chitin deacetylase (PgdA/CDA1 family)
VARLCALSVDLDGISEYAGLHGLAAPAGAAAHVIYDLGVARIAVLASDRRCPVTWFAVGSDLARPENAARLRDLVAQGHEIGNHSLDHRYDLTLLDPDRVRRQVQGGIQAIEAATGTRPVGFRAPGYRVTDDLIDVLRECETEYDSSVFPCPAYYAAKAVAMAGIRLRGRKSRAVPNDPSALRAPRQPYRTGRPYWRRGTGLLEIPIGVTRGIRFPFIGTAITVLGRPAARLLAGGVIGDEYINLELHGIDAIDATDDRNLAALARKQADLRVSLAHKLDALGAVLDALRAAGYGFARLRDLADAVGKGI